jgi:hypothetical protein
VQYLDRFFNFARKRHEIYLRRQAGLPRSEWTQDPILSTYRFTNVYRELDRTTIWYRENVREKLPEQQMLLATVVFRWFNRIETGERIFNTSAWSEYWSTYSNTVLRHTIVARDNKGPYVTGAYIIKTPDGMNKLDGVLWCIKEFRAGMGTGPHSKTLEGTWRWMKQFPFMGPFMAYEVVTDLRWTILKDAPDIMMWANPGPGANRGIQRIMTGRLGKEISYGECVARMQTILQVSKSYWPMIWDPWEMREVEHTLCEFDKYERVRNGEGKPRGVYR